MIYLFVLGRILVGGYFILSGYNHFKNLKNFTGYAKSKGTPMPREAVLLSGFLMFIGGAGILLGVYVHYSILILIVTLLIITLQMHQFWKVTDQMAKMGEEINFKKNIALVGALCMMLAIPLSAWVSASF